MFKIRTEEPLKIPAGALHRASTPTVPEYQFVLEGLDCIDDLREKISAGWMPGKISEYIYVKYPDQVVDLHITRSRFEEHVASYRKKMAPAELVAIRMPEEIIKAKEKIDSGINIMEEMQSLYKIQKDRIDIDVKTEKKLGKLFKTTGNEISIAAQLLRDMAEIMQSLGVNNANPAMESAVREKLITDFGLRYGKESVAKVLNDPKAVSKVLSVAESMFKALRSDAAVKLLLETKQEIKDNPVEVVPEVQIAEEMEE